MPLFTISDIGIAGIAASIPKNTENNHDISFLSEKEKNLLVSQIGINKRRITDGTTFASDLCLSSASILLKELDWDPKDIQVLVSVTQTPDKVFPGNSFRYQNELGVSDSCITLDLNSGCSGYVVGLAQITSLMAASGLRKGLLMVGDTLSKSISESDRSTIPIFGDAGTTTALERQPDSKIHFSIYSDGKEREAIHQDHSKKMKMNGLKVFDFSLKKIAPSIQELLEYSKTKSPQGEIDFFIMHQANKIINEAIRRKLKFDLEKVPYSFGEFGNTSSCTIPLTICNNLSDQLRENRKKLLLSGFGVGLSWASAILETDKICLPKISEI